MVTGKADKHLCEVILSELKQATVKTTDDPIRYKLHLCIDTSSGLKHWGSWVEGDFKNIEKVA